MDLPIDDENAALYAVGQVADMLGVQPAFLRRLDLERVVQPARSDGGQRRYSRAEIVQVQRVWEMAAEGMSLAGIRRILELEVEVADLRRQMASEEARSEQTTETIARERPSQRRKGASTSDAPASR
ncbi:MAG: MerR family transcriptional regulator [Acidimicrobiales bacterium]